MLTNAPKQLTFNLLKDEIEKYFAAIPPKIDAQLALEI
jgi:hypothetical protein